MIERISNASQSAIYFDKGSTNNPKEIVCDINSPNAIQGKGYGIITDNRLCVFVKKDIESGETLDLIRLMFRHNI